MLGYGLRLRTLWRAGLRDVTTARPGPPDPNLLWAPLVQPASGLSARPYPGNGPCPQRSTTARGASSALPYRDHLWNRFPMKRQPLLRALLATLLSLFAAASHASCGSAYCTLMTDRYAQGAAGEQHLGWSTDVRLEMVTQNRLRSGSSSIDASQVTGEDAIERHTKNLNLITTLSYGFEKGWSVSLRAPVVRRDHLHDLVDEQTGLPSTSEQWRFTRLGDVQVIARRQVLLDGGATAYALFGGLKLPSGSISVRNANGSRAERALQPGTGTTDVVLGAAGRRAIGLNDALIGQASVSQALNSREDFKPGARLELSAGWSHAYSQRVGTVVQLNLRKRRHDSGAQAEPANSGSTTLDLSPGVTLAVGSSSTLYAYVQLPLYQRVNGIQLVPSNALVVGWTSDF